MDTAADVDDGGRESRFATSMMTVRRMKVTGQGPISVDEIDKAGQQDGSEDGSVATGHSWHDVGTIGGGVGDGDSIR